MFANLSGWHALLLLAVVLLLFGAARLPALARSIGQSARVFKDEVHVSRRADDAADDAAGDGADAAPPRSR